MCVMETEDREAQSILKGVSDPMTSAHIGKAEVMENERNSGKVHRENYAF